jgi:malate dehydrogenase (oxaloacetate-decarboxylating)(NADP+)
MSNDHDQDALDYHAASPAGKIAIASTKPCATPEELALAYTPGVAAPVRAIAANPADAYQYTAKGNLVAVITDGSAVLGLGNVGALAGKPVMEGKAVLFKRFAGIDAFDLEVNAGSAEDFIKTVISIAPTFGGINLEDIAAPACFEIEERLRAALDIPVMHDDQHGTAVVVGSGLLNALALQNKQLEAARIVCIGAGAAGIATLKLLIELGARRENILLVDREGVVQRSRRELAPHKQAFAADSPARTLAEAMRGADVLLGVSGPKIVTPEMVKSMAARPVVFALSNPEPEIRPELVRQARADALVACGRSDYPNQVNNVLGFPFIFRGALDVRAQAINTAMLLAATQALAALTREPALAEVLAAYRLETLEFGPDYFIPKPLDPRLKSAVAGAVARAAVTSGVAQLPLPSQYRG